MCEPWNSVVAVVMGLALMVALPLWVLRGLATRVAQWGSADE